MRHFRPDYDKRIQDSAGLIPADEPVFLIRAKDVMSLPTLSFYISLYKEKGITDARYDNLMSLHAAMLKWQNDHPDDVRVADAPV